MILREEFPELYNKSKTQDSYDGQINIEGTVYDAIMELYLQIGRIVAKTNRFWCQKIEFYRF